MTLEEVRRTLNDFFSNKDLTRGEVREGLEELEADIEVMLEALDEDERKGITG